jgi:hypothetical protein
VPNSFLFIFKHLKNHLSHFLLQNGVAACLTVQKWCSRSLLSACCRDAMALLWAKKKAGQARLF